MYKIYINKQLLFLAQTNEIEQIKVQVPNVRFLRYTGRTKQLLQVIDNLEKATSHGISCVYTNDYQKLKEDFKSLFKSIKACGGLVVNNLGEGLFIFKRGMWDLPKGKMDGLETNIETASREVEEETGIQGLTVLDKICKTKHVFRNKKNIRCIKKTHWYSMRANKQPLIAETEEDIEKAEWRDIQTMHDLANDKIYENIKIVLRKYLSQNVS